MKTRKVIYKDASLEDKEVSHDNVNKYFGAQRN